MTDSLQILAQLKALAERGTLQPRSQQQCEAMIARLERPVRVVVSGQPGSGKTAVLHALAGQAILHGGIAPVPVALRHGTRSTVTLTLADGGRETQEASLPLPLPPDCALAEAVLPLESLKTMSLLCLATDGSAQDLSAGLHWASGRCDIALWCTKAWSAMEQQVWDAAPDRLKHHALLIATGRTAGLPRRTGQPAILHCPTLGNTPGAALLVPGAEALRSRLAAMIAAARSEDSDAALAFLESRREASRPVVVRSVAKPEAKEAAAVQPILDSTLAALPHAARASLEHMLRETRSLATTLLTSAPANHPLLPAIRDCLDGLVERAEDEPGLAELWPDGLAMLREAGELTLLLGLEAGDATNDEAAALLAQVRQEIEMALAA